MMNTSNYTHSYLNGKHVRLYRGIKWKTFCDGSRHSCRFWEMGIGRLVFTFGRWA